MLWTILIILLILSLIGGLPAWGFTGPVAYGPSLLLVIVLLIVLFGGIRG